MNICIKIYVWIKEREKARQWCWFLLLWLVGLATVMALAYPIKWLMKSL
jgi:hypothetical protein